MLPDVNRALNPAAVHSYRNWDRIPDLLLELERLTAILLSHDLVAIEHHLRNLRTDFVIQNISDLSGRHSGIIVPHNCHHEPAQEA
jgi:hypothetical protein